VLVILAESASDFVDDGEVVVVQRYGQLVPNTRRAQQEKGSRGRDIVRRTGTSSRAVLLRLRPRRLRFNGLAPFAP
jgi:hypothetical protein